MVGTVRSVEMILVDTPERGPWPLLLLLLLIINTPSGTHISVNKRAATTITTTTTTVASGVAVATSRCRLVLPNVFVCHRMMVENFAFTIPYCLRTVQNGWKTYRTENRDYRTCLQYFLSEWLKFQWIGYCSNYCTLAMLPAWMVCEGPYVLLTGRSVRVQYELCNTTK